MNQQGFTLLEVLLSVTIIAMLVAVSLPVYETFVRRNDLDLTTQNTVALIRRAEVYARAVNGDSAWGIEFLPSGTTLFKGTAYATRDAGYDETITLPGSVTQSGMSEVVFSKLSAIPGNTGALTLSSTTNDVITISINAKGMVDY